MSLSLPARTLRPLAPPGVPLTIPAGTRVLVVEYESIGGPYGGWILEHQGHTFRAPHDAVELLLPVKAEGSLTFDNLLKEVLRYVEVTDGEAPAEAPTWGEPGKGRPSLQEINSFLIEKELQYRNAGTMSRDEFLRRKAVLMERIRRSEEER